MWRHTSAGAAQVAWLTPTTRRGRSTRDAPASGPRGEALHATCTIPYRKEEAWMAQDDQRQREIVAALRGVTLFRGAPRSAAATALEDCRLLFLPRDAFRRFLEAHPAALWTCLEVIVGQLRRLTAVADDLALLDLRARLARCLLRL